MNYFRSELYGQQSYIKAIKIFPTIIQVGLERGDSLAIT